MEYEWHRDPAWDPFAKVKIRTMLARRVSRLTARGRASGKGVRAKPMGRSASARGAR